MRHFKIGAYGTVYSEKELKDMGWSDAQLSQLTELAVPNVDTPPQCPPIQVKEPPVSLLRSQHPLLNPESKHYEMIGGVQAIELMESMFTVDELMAWAKLTAMKYRLRIGDKDAPEKEIAKIKTFEAYWRYLDARK